MSVDLIFVLSCFLGAISCRQAISLQRYSKPHSLLTKYSYMINFLSIVISLNMNVSKKDFSNVEDSADVEIDAETLQLELHYPQ